jgi:adenylate cyclase
MGIEIERKFLVRRELLPRDLPAADEIEQGYLSASPTVRVRTRQKPGPGAERKGELTIKGKGKLSRAEWNYDIPAAEAEELLELCATSLRKTRRELGRWELDYFADRDLWLAEIELEREDEPFERPEWLGDEVTSDGSYSNSRLASERVRR